MKKITSCLLSLVVIANCFLFFRTNGKAADNSVTFNINANQFTGSKIDNIVGYMNTWNHNGLKNAQCDGETDISFVEYIELMTATGGDSERDLIDENGQMIEGKLNALAEACQGVLNLDAKPLIKLGCIPFYFTMGYNPNKELGQGFGFNVFPPDDDKYDEYQQYIENVIEFLVGQFGLDEVRSWRFGVMTEYENDEWFYVTDTNGNIDTNKTKESFFKIYDYSLKALENVLGAEYVYIGAHSMTVTEGCWDERDFIDHIASGYNYADDAYTGTQIDYLAASFYDVKPEEPTSGLNLVDSINYLRSYAESKGLYNLKYGVDEGRILYGVNYGSTSNSLATRVVGHTWQAGYDAHMYKQMIDNNIDYFCSWSWTSDTTIGKGYPTISYHVANSLSKMVGMDRVKVTKSSASLQSGVEADTFAAYDSESRSLSFMAYSFKDQLSYGSSIDMNFRVNVPDLARKRVIVRRYMIDSSCNYFDEWWADRERYGITNDKFTWSPDDPTIDSTTTLSDANARTLYFNNLRDKYIEASRLKCDTTEILFDASGNANISLNGSSGNFAVYYEIKEADNLNRAIVQAESLNADEYSDFSAVKNLLSQAKTYNTKTDEERNLLADEIHEAISLLIKNKRIGKETAVTSQSTSYDHVYLFSKISLINTDEECSANYQSTNDSGSTAYFLEGNDTYDSNGFHVWNRCYQNGSTTSAHYYVDRFAYTDLSQLGKIVKVDFTTWGKNHQHSVGIFNVNAQMIDGNKNSVNTQGTLGNEYAYSLTDFTCGSPFSAGSATDFKYTPNAEIVTTSNDCKISGAVPMTGESVSFRIGTRTTAIDANGWGNLMNYFCWTDVTVTAYDTTELRNEVGSTIENGSLYTKSSYSNYYNAYKNAINIINNSSSQAEIDSARDSLIRAKSKLILTDSVLYGDVNSDGFVNGMDAVIAKCFLENMLTENDFMPIQFEALDANCDEEVTYADAEFMESKGLLLR